MNRSSSIKEDQNIKRRTLNGLKELSPMFDAEKLSRKYDNTHKAPNGAIRYSENPFDDKAATAYHPEGGEDELDHDQTRNFRPSRSSEDKDRANGRPSPQYVPNRDAYSQHGTEGAYKETSVGQDDGWEEVSDHPPHLFGQFSSEITASTATEQPRTSAGLQSESLDAMSEVELRQYVNELEHHMREQAVQLQQIRITQLQQNTRRGPGLSDQDLINSMQALRTDVFNWIMSYSDDVAHHTLSKARHEIQDLVPEYDTYLESAKLHPWLIQTHFWALLLKYIFGDERKLYGYAWSGVVKPQTWIIRRKVPLKRLRNAMPLELFLRPDAMEANEQVWKDYLEWRVSTFSLLYPGSGRDIKPRISPEEAQTQVSIVTRRIWKRLQTYVGIGIGGSRSRNAESELRYIVAECMRFDIDLKKQMAEYRVKFPTLRYTGNPRNPYRFRFSPEEMQDKIPGSAGNDGFITAPALYKSHDWTEGARGEGSACIFKAEVYRRRPPGHQTKQSSIRSTSTRTVSTSKPSRVREVRSRSTSGTSRR